MTNLEKLRAAIIEAVPEIMELKFGCEIDVLGDLYTVLFHEEGGKSFNGENTEYYGPVTQVHTGDFLTELWGDSPEATHDYPLKSNIKVLGRPITLADVLRAVKVAGKNIGVSNRGKFMRQIDGAMELWEEMETSFDLAKNLDDQSPECIDFLTSVLCK